MAVRNEVLRSLRRSPGFVAMAVASLGLALGVTTTTYAVLDALVHPYVPFSEPDRLMSVRGFGDGARHELTRYDLATALREGTTFHEGIALMARPLSSVVRSGENADAGTVTEVSNNLFPLLGVQPLKGRIFSDGPDDSRAAVISYDLWRWWFGKTANWADMTLHVDGRSFSVIGVMPPSMADVFGTQVWLRMPNDEATRATNAVQFIARLKPGVAPAAAKVEATRLAADLTALHGVGRREFMFLFWPITPDPTQLQRFHVALGGAALVVLLIACANLANLMLARGMRQRRDYALRMALGATRTTIVKHVLWESALLAGGGGALGILAAVWANDMLVHSLPPSIELIGGLGPVLSWRVFLFGLLATAATILLFGLLPAMRLSNTDVSEPLKDSAGATTGQSGSRYNAIVISEIVLAMILVMGGGLLLRAAQRVADFEFGYDPHGLLRLWIPGGDAPADSVEALTRRIANRAAGIDGVLGVASMRYESPDHLMVTSDVSGEQGEAELNMRTVTAVSHGFLATLRIPIVEGRDFLPGDLDAGGAVIVNETAARALWPDGDAVGSRIKLGRYDAPRPWLLVVGVARNVRGFEEDPDMLLLPPRPTVYFVSPKPAGGYRMLVVRTNPSSPAVAADLAVAVFTESWSRWTPSISAFSRDFKQQVDARRFVASLFGLFGTFAVALAALGLYGVLSYGVSVRMREFGVRVALGATRKDLLRLVLHDGAVMWLAGTGAGAFLAMWSARLLTRWLYDVHPADVTSLLVAELVLVLACFLGCLAPALRAARADPLMVIRAT